MHTIDYLIVAGYLAGLLVIGLVLARRAGRDMEGYFLGGHAIPWWALGASGMSSNLDAAGTMTILTLIYLYGLHGVFIEMRGGVVLPIAVFVAFMGKWHRRSDVTTTAEWMELRFGGGWEGRAARVVAALTYLVITVGMVVFFVAAAGKFLAVFLPWGPNTCSIGIAAVALIYTVLSGLYGVVWTDVFQAVLIAGAAGYVSIRAWVLVSPELLAQWPGAALNDVLPHWRDGRLGQYEWFGFFLMAWFGKGLLEGLGGSGGSAYMAQRFYAAHSDRDCQKIGMLWTVLFAVRWPMILGFAVLAISLGIGRDDPEKILPLVLSSDYFPPGVRGLVVAAIFAASMSTFDSTINAGASYVVKDLYQPWFPRAGPRGLVWVGYGASVLIVALGLALALWGVRSILEVWKTIVIQLFPAFLVPFALRWYWARFNGVGFTLGVIAGFAAAIGLNLHPDGALLNEIGILTLIAGCSLAGSLVGTFATPAVPEDRLERFYRQVRPFGLWPRAWKEPYRHEHRLDVIRLVVALAWQLLTFLLPMLFVLKMYPSLGIGGLIWVLMTRWLLKGMRGSA